MSDEKQRDLYQVASTGELFRYKVQKRIDKLKPEVPITEEREYGNLHMIDLISYGGNGACDCRDFSVRCIKNLKKEQRIIEYGSADNPNGNRTRCKHITLALNKFTNDILKNNAKTDFPRMDADF